MIAVVDPQVRLVLLSHLAVRAGEAGIADLRTAGLTGDEALRLRALSAVDIAELAAMHTLPISMEIDLARLSAAMNAVLLLQEARAQEAYFIRHGASCPMMHDLFKLPHKETLRRRKEFGTRRPRGPVRRPDSPMRARILLVWTAMADRNPRRRYHRLHQAFPNLHIAQLAAVIRAAEADQ